MNTRFILTAAALLAFCPAINAQILPAVPASPASPTAPASAPVTLRYKFAVGQVHRYEYDMDMNMDMMTGQNGGAIPMNMAMHVVMRQTVKSISPTDGAATLSTQIESVKMLQGGQEVSVPEEAQAKMKQPFTQVMLPTGKILSMAAPGLSGVGPPGMDFSKDMFSMTALLPDGPVKIGDNWKGSADAAAMGAEMQLTATLTGVDQKDGAVLATIQQMQKGTFDQPMPEAGESLQGQVTGKATQIFDTSAGAIQSATGTSGADITMALPKSADGTMPAGMPAAMKMQMQMKYTMTRLSDTPPTAIAPAQ